MGTHIFSLISYIEFLKTFIALAKRLSYSGGPLSKLESSSVWNGRLNVPIVSVGEPLTNCTGLR
jgi:hypothetical protein